MSLNTKEEKIASIGDYCQLLKPKIMSLVVFTGITGMTIAPGNIHPFIAIISILCIALGSGAAGAINMWYDSDIDAIMKRTKNRPIPAGKIKKSTVLEFGLVLAILSITIMAISVNYISAIILTISINFYIIIYTIILKRRTSQNVVIGGIAGAFPPIIGWTSVTGSISLESLILFSIIFMWTPPHSWALSLLNYNEYKKANIPMMPVVYGIHKTKLHILFYSLILIPITLFPGIFVKYTILYEISATILGTIFLIHVLRIFKHNNALRYKQLFTYSIYYLFLLFAVIILSK
ncbi:protoheme IX farnesyltransferase [Neoehrlichia mikurensis]|uniref:Protoheme IX farnesyltransferase n=1 Tax=Neoehrlichia mikurensis TaxID=89586 RepID=A0A9Q9BYB0_9RICK|nr:heme o synthase [Neoehrlichia mikurensis]QXK91669.1 protoheme IX farnesyltransferase [Neoehrlichia mikurensis]QXK92880.1 protoheme IX farnesyltransferase [Neoehrlichia mikurensis]QXK93360.1 protoheme IX farnesyltransferase [Neoehrlichia mikurensis]UTO55696.1 heme o synthase [Neoehrlichia mikurensis]UTO56613.1 heme o synthase [Neoehrlichia mikurensis]